jgi:NAD(P)H-dependent flavin oxidoreductase YrpB (nitropropane dioxygenase family)
VPDGHREYASKILADHGVPDLPADEKHHQLLGWTAITAGPQVDVILQHDKAKLIANALGTPPEDVVAQIQSTGRLVGALCGSVRHALKHKAAGLDFVVCQGTEGGGHCGEISSLVLWPQVIDALDGLPVLAAGGVGNGRQVASAMAMGAAGVWTGSLWLTVEEADVPPAQMQTYLDASSHDTVRSRAFTGKPCRMLRNDWTDAWEAEDSPEPLPMPLQMMVALDAVERGYHYPEAAKDVNFNPVGQVVGQLDRIERAGQVVSAWSRSTSRPASASSSSTPAPWRRAQFCLCWCAGLRTSRDRTLRPPCGRAGDAGARPASWARGGGTRSVMPWCSWRRPQRSSR